MTTSLPPYQLAVDGVDASLRVHSFTGTEALSEAWCFDIVVTAPGGGDDLERAALGQRATLILDLAGKQRALYGIVAAVRLAEVHRADHSVKYALRIVPRLWLLKRKKRTRIFQNMRVPDIVSSVLLEAGIATRWQLVRAYPEREYCTQYEETDYQLVRRLLAEVGIYFYFFGGGPVSSAALAADAAVGAAAAVGSDVAGLVGGSAVGGLIGAAAQMGETLIPGDTVVGADDAACYPPVGGDDPAALAASTAAAMAPAIGDVLGAGDGIAGAAIGAASAVAGTVIADVTEGARAVPALHFMGNLTANVTFQDKITHFALRNTVRSSASAFRDYDPDRPMVRLQSAAVSTQPFPPSPFEMAAMAAAAAENAASAAANLIPGAAGGVLGAVGDAISTADSVVNDVGAALGKKVPAEVYEHHGPFLFPKWAFAADEAPRILRQKRRRASIAKGESGCSDFSPGHRFALDDHPAPQLDGPYVLTRVEHRGELHPSDEGAWKVYSNTFECAPAEMTYPPPRPKRKSVQVMLTATVVGPAGEEIHVDQKGQIKVQFHWDREGKYDENSSCWIRVMQPWAGAGWGAQFIPRVGMEVVVGFEGGDPDKPMVLGSVYNGTHPSPFQLPGDKTRSGWRTQSSIGGNGYNELSFEDRAGDEEIHLHAQRDLNEMVRHDQTTSVGNDRTLRVGRHLVHEIRGARTVAVHQSDSQTVRGDRSLTVDGHEGITVRGSHSLIVGNKDKPSPLDLFAWGNVGIGSEGGVTLQCGDSSISISAKEIAIHAPSVVLSGDTVHASGKGPSLTLGDDAEILGKKVRIFSNKASLELEDEARLDGEKINLNCKGNPPADSDDGPAALQPFTLKLTDEKFQPYAGKDYTLVAGGRKYEGTTGGDGAVTEQIPALAKTARLILWLKDKPVGARMVYRITIDDVPDASTVRGAWARLQNLGYHSTGEPEELDDTMREALSDFQEDHGLPRSGELDDATRGKLAEVHGS